MKYYKRGFLNPKEGMAAFEASLENEDFHTCGSFDGSFSITDCVRRITLDFSAWNLDDAEKNQ